MRVNRSESNISCGGVDDCFIPNLSNGIESFTLTLIHHANGNEKEEFSSSKMSSRFPELKKLRRIPTPVEVTVRKCQLTDTNDEIQRILVEEHIFQNGYKPDLHITPCSEMFSCSACSEVFYMKSGLESHENREIMTICLKCECCGLYLTFLNRCLLLKHFEEHNVVPTVTSLKNSVTFEPLKASPMTYDYRIRLSDNSSSEEKAAIIITSRASLPVQQIGHPFIWPPPVEIETDNLPAVSPTRENQLDQYSTHLTNSLTTTTFTPFAEDVIMTVTPDEYLIKQEPANVQLDSNETSRPDTIRNSTYHWCSCCKRDFLSAGDFIAHIKNAERTSGIPNIGNAKSFVCDLDGVPSNSNCGYQYHKDLFHEKCFTPPFFCPECGKSFHKWDMLNAHARIRCCHFKKSIRYKCLATGGCIFSAASHLELSEHLEAEHFRHILQCGKCSNAFTTDDMLLKHLRTEHGINAGMDDENSMNKLIDEMTKKLIQCLICRVVFCTIEDYRVHLKSKSKTHCFRGIFFPCHVCPMVFSSGQTLCLHNRRSHAASAPIPPASRTQPEEVQIPTTTLVKNEDGIRFVSLEDLIEQKNDFDGQVRNKQRACFSSKRKLPVDDVVNNSADTGLNVAKYGKVQKQCLSVGRVRRPLQKCRYCSRRSTPNAILNHEKVCTQNSLINLDLIKVEDGEHECKKCNIKFGNTATFNLHTCCPDRNQMELKCEVIASIPTDSSPTNKLNTFKTKIISNSVSDMTKAFTCAFCSLKEFHSMAGLKKHVRLHHKAVDFDSVDWKAMTRDPVAATLRRRRQRMVRRMRPRETPAKLESSPQKRQRVSASETDDVPPPKIEPGSGRSVFSICAPMTVESQRKESKARQSDGTFKCLKCPDAPLYSTELTFFEHVKLEHVLKNDIAHTDDSPEFYKEYIHDGFYCPECGMEFVVKPALKRHLLCAHEFIQNSEDYLNSIGYGVRPMKPLKENQCEVCRLQCLDTLDYEKHIRTHGMAFLRLRRQRKSNESN